MWAMFQSVDVALDLAWASLCVATLLAWRFSGCWREHKQAVVAVLAILVLLFPVISTADDIAEQAWICDLSASPLSLSAGKEIKQAVVAIPQIGTTAAVAALPLTRMVGEGPAPESSRSYTRLLSSASGIHSPPQQ